MSCTDLAVFAENLHIQNFSCIPGSYYNNTVEGLETSSDPGTITSDGNVNNIILKCIYAKLSSSSSKWGPLSFWEESYSILLCEA